MFPAIRTKVLAYSYGRLVPHGAHLSLREPHLVPGVRTHSMSTLLEGSSWCNMSPASTKQKYLFCLWQACAPWGSFVFERAPFGSWSTNSLHVDPFWGVQLVQHVSSNLETKVLAYSYGRLVPHGAHLSLTEPHLVSGVRIHSLSTLLEGPAGATCLQHLQKKSTCFVSGRLVPHGAHLSLKEPHLVLGVPIHSVLIRFGGV